MTTMADRVRGRGHGSASAHQQTQGGGRGGRGGSRGGARTQGHGGRGQQPQQERPKKEAILNLGKYVDQRLRVKFAGGREGSLLVNA